MTPLRLAVRLGAVAVTCSALAVPGTAIAIAGVAAVSHKGILPPQNPARSVQPRPFFLSSPRCYGGQDSARCNAMVLRAVTRARQVLEKLTGMSFSLSAYEQLTPAEQLFVAVNLERTDRGLAPATVLTRSLDRVAQIGANRDEDPPLGQVPDPLPGGGQVIGLGGNWAGGWDNALGADYGWMYDDGPGGANGACNRRNQSGCWGHRNNILGTFNSNALCGGERNELALGAGHVTSGKAYGDSETELFVGICGPTPTDVILTWNQAKRLLHI